jgi:integrase
MDEGTAFSRHEDNKGKRDQLVQLHPIVVDHLERIRGFSPLVFSWPSDITVLYKQFRLIQEAAGIKLPCREKDEHTPTCYVYGFHDFRRAFATANAETLSADVLQRLMQHRSYLTTQRYINMAHQVKQAAEKLHVPDVLRRAMG